MEDKRFEIDGEEFNSQELTDETQAVEESIEETEEIAEVIEDVCDDEAIENVFETKKCNRKRNLFIAIIVVAAVLLAGLVYSICTINSVFKNTVVNTPLPSMYDAERKLIDEKFNIKFESPIMSIFSAKDNEVLNVNGFGVKSGIFSSQVFYEGEKYQESLYRNGVQSFTDFDWNENDDIYDLKRSEIAKGEAVINASKYFALVSEAQKKGIKLSEEDEKNLSAMKEQYEKYYGDNIDTVAKESGFENFDQFIEINRYDMLVSKFQTAFNEDPLPYIGEFKDYKKALADDMISVKHILIKFPEGVSISSTEEEKAETKKKAQDILAKVNSGEDFDKLVFDYNEDAYQSGYGFTFGKENHIYSEIFNVSNNLEIGKTSDLVETSYGYHIIKRLERMPAFDEYAELLTKNMKVRINSYLYSKIPVNADITPQISSQQAYDYGMFAE